MAETVTVAAAPGDGPDVDSYTDAAHALVMELRAWMAVVDAADPSGRERALAAWQARQDPPSSREERWALEYGAPTACYAVLRPPAPDWVVEEPGPRIGPLRHLCDGEDYERFMPFDRAWLGRGRAAWQVLNRSLPPYTWSAPGVVRADLLSLDGGDPDALRGLLARARGAAPVERWTRDAGRLLDGPEGEAALGCVERWLAVLPVLGAGMPSGPENELANTFSTYCRHVRQAMAAHGDARAAALAELRGQARAGVYRDGSSDFETHRDHPCLLSEDNGTILRGCIWLLSQAAARPGGRRDVVALLGRTALACLVRAPVSGGVQYRSLKGVNSCVMALGRIATPEAVTALGRIRLRVRDDRLSRQIAAAMAEAAARAGMTIEDLEEVAVPSHGLDEVGGCRIALAAGHTATLAVASSTRVEVRVLRPDGRMAKAVPAAVRADTKGAAALKALKALAAELEKVLPVHRLRLERSWLTGRSWPGDAFRARMLDHPVMAWFTARLIWTVAPAGAEAGTCLVRPDGSRVDAGGHPLPPLRDDDTVALWHPLHAVEPGAAALWREALEREGITQPIRQAHRETYPLTPAEDGIHSNRFAGHILRQARLLALARTRGWSARARIDADVPNDEPLHLPIPAHGLAVEYWTEGAGGADAETTDAQAYVFVKTDQIRFRRLHDRGDWRRDGGRGLALGTEAVPLAAVPPVVFSEAMRDIDLFVGVASIGHDPGWTDAGAAAEHPSQWRRTVAEDYWQAFNGAELSEGARARHELLRTLMPRLAIAERLRLEERHLVVRGIRHGYRIHVGSGNVAIEPDGRYLCIVPQPERNGAARPRIWLPFEEDRLLSVILSKAMLLANDDRITDPSILRQFPG